MTIITKIALALVLILTTSLAFACDYPARPHIPDGSTASKDEILSARSEVQGYIAAVDDYLLCIENDEKAAIAEIDDPSAEELQRRDDMLNKKFDAAHEEKVLVAEQLNQQIRAYKQKPKSADE